MDEYEIKLIRTMYDWIGLKRPTNLEKKDFKDVLYILFEKYVRNDVNMLDFIKYIDTEVDISITHIEYNDMYNMVHEMYEKYEKFIHEKDYQFWLTHTPMRVLNALNDIDRELFDICKECELDTPCKEILGDLKKFGLEIDVLKLKVQDMIK